MADYLIKTGHDQLLAALLPFVPQPTSVGIQFARRDYALNGAMYEQGAYIEFVWNVLNDEAAYATLLTQCGLGGSAAHAAVTIYCRNERFQWGRYNGRAIRPEQTWQFPFPRNIVLLVRDLEQI